MEDFGANRRNVMTRLGSVRPARVLVGVLGIVAIGVAGFAMSAPAAQEQAPLAVGAGDEGGVCQADEVITEPAGETAAPGGGNPCKDCKRSPEHHRCTRVSCDPCCWVCIGEPLPICAS